MYTTQTRSTKYAPPRESIFTHLLSDVLDVLLYVADKSIAMLFNGIHEFVLVGVDFLTDLIAESGDRVLGLSDVIGKLEVLSGSLLAPDIASW